MMDIGKSFSYLFEDDEWLTKLLLGAVVSAIPILNFAWTGYTIDILRNVMNGVTFPMPDWSDFGDKFVKGFLVWLAGFIYSLPALLVICLPMGWLIVFPATSESTNTADTLAAIFTGVGILLLCILILYLLALSFYFPAVFINFAKKGTFGACFEVSEIIKIVSRNSSKYLTAWLVTLVAGIVVGILMSVVGAIFAAIICIGWLITWVVTALGSVYLFAVYAHLFGQVAADESASLMPVE